MKPGVGVTIRNRVRMLLVMAIVPMAIGCTSQVTSEVTRFHRAPAPHGETITIVPVNDDKQSSIEFATYATKVAEELAKLGYHVVDSGDSDLIARMDYSVGEAQTRIRSWPRNYVHYHFRYDRYYPYYFGRYWDEPNVYSYTVFPRLLQLDILQTDGQVVFEGRVESVGRQANMNSVFPYMLKAMFQNFPGESGVTKVVTIRKDDGEPY
ncbi:MAG: DUF4136 domain-containing protein [Pseudomonadales bacterium]